MVKYISLILLFLVTVSFGASSFDEALPPDINEVLFLYNSNSTFDADGDGTIFNTEVINELKTIPGFRWSTRLCAIKTRFTNNDANRPQTTTFDEFCAYFDTTAAYDYDGNTDVSLPVGNDYILEKTCECYNDAGGTDSIKYITIIGPDFPLKIRENNAGDYTVLPTTSVQLTPVKSVDTMLELFVRPTAETTFPLPGVNLKSFWTNQFRDSMENKKTKVFKPNYYYQVRLHEVSQAKTADSLTQYVLVTRLDGIREAAVITQIRKSLKPQGFTPQGTAQFYAVVDTRKDLTGGGAYPHDQLVIPVAGGSPLYNHASSYYYDLKTAFGTKTLFDVLDTLVIAYPGPNDTLIAGVDGISSSVYFGYSGGQTISGSDSVLFYHTCASYHSNDIPTNIAQQTTMNIASNAFVTSSESWNYWTGGIDTSLRSGTSDDQTLLLEYLDNNYMGFTYGLGNVHEVGSNSSSVFAIKNAGADTNSIMQKTIEAMYTPNCPFAIAGNQGIYRKQMSVKIGMPVGYWRKGVVPTAESLVYASGKRNSVIYSCNVPLGIDSVRLYMTTTVDTVDTTINVTAFSSFTKIMTSQTGTFNKFFVSFVGIDSYRHARRIYVVENNNGWENGWEGRGWH